MIQEIYNRYCEIRKVCIEISKEIKNEEYQNARRKLSELTSIDSLEYLINNELEVEDTGLWSKLSELIGYLKNRIELLPKMLDTAEKLKEEGEYVDVYEKSNWKLIDKTIGEIDEEFKKYDLSKNSATPIYA